ncbi:MAG: hypothetical protein ACI9NC_002472, partial [Verrucomicrobiales bacterium]
RLAITNFVADVGTGCPCDGVGRGRWCRPEQLLQTSAICAAPKGSIFVFSFITL